MKLCLLGFLALTLAALPAFAEPVLERVLILERHGVRPPTKPPAAFAKYSAEPWPRWPVAPGELTPHGEEAMQAMAEGLRTRYGSLLPQQGCAPSVFVWADNADQRTRRSGFVIARTLQTGCLLGQLWSAKATPDPWFRGACHIDEQAAATEVATRLDAMMKADGDRYERALAALNQILMPGCTGERCALVGETHVSASGKIEGPLSTAATLSENLLLEYAQGMPDKDVGWGRAASPAKIAAVMPLHEMESDLTRATPLLAARNASRLAQFIAEFLARREGEPEGLRKTRFILLLGHDTNLSNIAGMLGISWHLPDEPDSTGPGTALAFEVWKEGARQTVRVVVLYQTLEQLRSAASLGGEPKHVSVSVPGCSRRGCAPDALAAHLTQAIPPACRSNQSLSLPGAR